MQYNLDPLTGLPVIGGTDIVSQIPLGTQVVPWGDIGPSTLPQQGPAYPNDIINTFGWVTGEEVANPGVIRAGTMTPDRRLRVDTGGGGAAGPISAQTYDWQTGMSVIGLSGVICTGPPIGKKLYWISVGVGMDPQSTTGTLGKVASCQIFVPTDNHFGSMPIVTFPLVFPGSAQPGPQYLEVHRSWPDGLLPVQPHDNGGGFYEFWYQQGPPGLNWALSLVYGAE